MSEERVPTVGLDQADVAELAELCAHVAGWLSHAPDAVGASKAEDYLRSTSLDRHAGPGWRFELRDRLLAWAERLETLEPLR